LQTDPERWEQGSEYHWLEIDAPEPPRRPWSSGLLLSSGRDALRAVVAVGVKERRWRRLWIPDYFCQDVVAALVSTGLELRVYADDPLREAPDLPDARTGDAVLVVNYFGLRERITFPRRDGVELIEDHTHDPGSDWARTSAADFCVASLRKTLPLPDGGVLWSPCGHALPPEPRLSAQRRRAAETKLTAMILKAMYLRGHPVEKEAFRSLALQGEQALGAPGVSAMSDVARAMLACWPSERWRRIRRANHDTLRGQLAHLEWARVLTPRGERSVPFSCVIVVDSAMRRERVRRRLIEAHVFPAVLWPLERPVARVRPAAQSVSRRLLSIHCDGRYDAEDMRRVASLVAWGGSARRRLLAPRGHMATPHRGEVRREG